MLQPKETDWLNGFPSLAPTKKKQKTKKQNSIHAVCNRPTSDLGKVREWEKVF